MTSNRCFSRRIRGVAALFAFSLAGLYAGTAAAEEPQSGDPAPVLVELFQSQSCNMCPPAAALFHEFAARKDIVALNWHVDYWNFTDSPKGRWEDPYSKAAYTDRQRRYNENIRQRSSIYTPQVIVAGENQTVGSNREKISTLIDKTKIEAAPITVEHDKDGLRFSVGESQAGGNAYLITFRKRAVTDITSGKNAGKRFDEVNVVTDVKPLGVVRRRGERLSAPAPKPGEGCALIVQAPGQRQVIAAAYCPV